jgi:hypothetical protein
MKMLFYSSDDSEVERVAKEFGAAGIPCEVRKGPPLKSKTASSPHAELWILNDRDCHRAFMLCVHLGAGFAKRASRRPTFDGTELEPFFPPERELGDEPGDDPEDDDVPGGPLKRQANG